MRELVGVVMKEDESMGEMCMVLPLLRSGMWPLFLVWSVGCCDDSLCGGKVPGYSRKSKSSAVY